MEFNEYGQPKSDNNLPVVQFFNDAIKDEMASKREGRPIFRDVEMVKISFAADRQRNLVRPAHAEWKKIKGVKVTYAERFAEQYRRFKAAEPQVVEGTPIKEAPFLSMAQRASLKALQVYTIEQLASLSGQPLKNIGTGGVAMQQQAQAYLEAARGTANVTALAEENAKLKELLAQMQAQETVGGAFDGMDDDALKDLIAERTGSRPRGNPNRATLERMASEVSEAA